MMCCVYLDPCVLIACLDKAKKLQNKYTKVGKRCLNLNRQANYRPQGAFADRAEVCLSIYIFTRIHVTIYITIVLSVSVIVLGQPLKI